ncbi:hypothetical protein J6590_033555 [Homalodisca vitripennis]|nr:hypothetical protein J6590_033555 [Homalodisca vitripennis]
MSAMWDNQSHREESRHSIKAVPLYGKCLPESELWIKHLINTNSDWLSSSIYLRVCGTSPFVVVEIVSLARKGRMLTGAMLIYSSTDMRAALDLTAGDAYLPTDIGSFLHRDQEEADIGSGVDQSRN